MVQTVRRILTGGVTASLLLAVLAVPAHARPAYRFEFKWGTFGTADNQLFAPRGIALDSSKRVYVADHLNGKIKVFSAAGGFLRKWSVDQPFDLAFSGAGDLYVSRLAANCVSRFHADGALVGDFGSYGTGDGQFRTPGAVAIDRTRGFVYVCDRHNSRIQKFNLDGGFLGAFGGLGSADGKFSAPVGIAVDGSGNLYVADTLNNRIQHVTAAGAFIRKWGSSGTANGQFSVPTGVAVDGSGFVYVVDSFNHRVQKFTAAGVFVTKFGTQGAGDGQMSTPQFIAISGDRLYVTDGGNNRVQRFRPNVTPTAPTKVTVSPALPKVGQKLTATATGSTDANGDTLTLVYAWFKSSDGVAWTAGPTAKVLPVTAIAGVGQYWKARARANDGDVVSAWTWSNVVRIAPVPATPLTASAAATGAGAQFTLQLGQPASVSVSIANLAGRMVAVLPARDLEAGLNTLLWDGRSSSGTRTPPGRYLVTIQALTPDGQVLQVVTPLRR